MPLHVCQHTPVRHVVRCAAIREEAEEGAADRQDHHAVEREVNTGCLVLPFIASVSCHRPEPDGDDAILQCAHTSRHPAGPQATDTAPSGRLPTAAEAGPASEQAVTVRILNTIHATWTAGHSDHGPVGWPDIHRRCCSSGMHRICCSQKHSFQRSSYTKRTRSWMLPSMKLRVQPCKRWHTLAVWTCGSLALLPPLHLA